MPLRAAPLFSLLLAAISLVPAPSRLARIAMVPLDDRPVGLQSAQLAGAIASSMRREFKRAICLGDRGWLLIAGDIPADKVQHDHCIR